MRRALALSFLALLLAAPAADAQPAPERAAAEQALARAERLLDGRGAGREPTDALRELATRLRDLDQADRRRARSLLARPADAAAEPEDNRYNRPEATPHCTANFCVHYVAAGTDAPNPEDADADAIPDYVEEVGAALELSYTRQNAELGWVEPKSDGVLGGGVAKTDAYLKDLGPEYYGYAALDPGQVGRSRYAYMVLENDFADWSGVDPLPTMKATSAHEYNHVLQFTYDIWQASWMYESTATWMEDVVFPSIDDYLPWVNDAWVWLTEIPLTADDPDDEAARHKIYGSAVWNLWLSGHYSADTVREAWARSPDNPFLFAPGAYDDGIRAEGGPGFTAAFGEFAAATAEWQTLPALFADGRRYRDVERLGSVTPGAPSVIHRLDHTTFKLLDVPPQSSDAPLHLSATLPAGTDGAVALVGREGPKVSGSTTIDVAQIEGGGSDTATLGAPNRFQRITAVLVNSSVAHSGLNGQQDDYQWRDDNERMGVALATGSTPPPPPDIEPPETTIQSGPPATTADTSATFTFSSSENPATFECSLDGQSFAPCSSPASYGNLAPGVHRFEVAAFDAAGNRDASAASYTWTVSASAGDTPPPAEPGPAVPFDPVDTLRPALASLRFGTNAFRALRRRGPSIAAPRGTTVTYSLSEDARVRFTVRRLVSGRRVRIRGSFRHAGSAGANSFRFTGRVGRRPLRPGRYELRARAQDAAGNLSLLKRARFRIVRR